MRNKSMSNTAIFDVFEMRISVLAVVSWCCRRSLTICGVKEKGKRERVKSRSHHASNKTDKRKLNIDKVDVGTGSGWAIERVFVFTFEPCCSLNRENAMYGCEFCQLPESVYIQDSRSASRQRIEWLVLLLCTILCKWKVFLGSDTDKGA